VTKSRTGSTKEVTNILTHVLMQRESAITNAEKNRVGVALYGLVMTNPNNEFWTTVRPGMKADKISEELNRMGVDPATALAGMQSTPTITALDKATGQVTRRLNPAYKQMENAITLKVNGEDRVILLNADNPRALRLARAMKNMDGLTSIDWSTGVLHKFFPNTVPSWVGVGPATRWMGAVLTQYSPSFGVSNFIRDIQGGALNLSSTDARSKRLEVLGNAPRAAAMIAAELSGLPSGQWGKLFRQFQADGGQTGFRDLFRDVKDRALQMERDLKRLEKGKALDPAKAAMAEDLRKWRKKAVKRGGACEFESERIPAGVALAVKAGISPSTVTRWARARRLIPVPGCERPMKFLGERLIEFARGNAPMIQASQRRAA
jgi:hypothetical protein